MILSTIISVKASELYNSAIVHTKSDQMRNADMSLSTQSTKEEKASKPIKDLGVFGEVFPIKEKNLLEVIQVKLQHLEKSGELEKHQKIIAELTKEKVNRPDAVPGIRKTTEPRTFVYDPSITVPYDLKDHQGQVFHRQGTKVNPLGTFAWRCPYLFIDGDDPDQVAWAIRQHQLARDNHKPKIILVKGAPFELSQRIELLVYFDQSGVLVKKFGICQVPARVSQRDRVLLVEELNVNGEQ